MINPQNKPQKTNRIFFAMFAIFVLCLVVFLFKSYILTISIGVLLAIATASVQNLFLNLSNGKKMLSAAITTVFLCCVFFIPFMYAMAQVVKYISNFDINSITSSIDYIKNYDIKLPESFEFLEPKIKEIIGSINITAIASKVLVYARASLEKSASFFIDISFIALFFFFSHLYGSELASYVKKITPMAKSELEFIFLEVANTMSVVFYSTIANILLQGFLFAIISWYYGYDALLFGILFAFASLIPIVGGALVYVPLSIYQFSLGDASGAVVILVYSILVISTLADNFIKPFIIKIINEKLLKTPAKINELLIFFAMIAGITSFGFWGIILGPAIITLSAATLKLYALLKERDIV
ncbi:acid membrane antigen A [Campylobacter iguaniorum]|uniref:Acid membrane antigen A n=1 Tax=Campylobacter iguaniorum TaxID=1244531 RepID=A0A076FAD5_9BACT|nr:AI-2E family transporter [Campylobacter iguaniorum]AII14432.1 acid membrane antigen A [Campylobacter iguaniorum]ALV24166.1 acid membrane antigen A [Campylobacter iguaniorum]